MRDVLKVATALAFLALLVAIILVPLRAHAVSGMMGVGSMMQGDSAPGGPPSSGAVILTEDSAFLTTEDGTPLRTE